MSIDLVALEIARAWGRDPWWFYSLARHDVEALLGWWRAIHCEAPRATRKQTPLSSAASATRDGRAFWLGG